MVHIRLSYVVSTAFALSAIALSAPPAVYGQQSGSSAFGGSRTLGQGTSSKSGSSSGQGGGRSPSSSGGGMSAGGGNLQQQQSGAGQVSGNERFVPGSRQSGTFVGGDTGDVRNARSQGGGAMGGRGGLQQLFSQFRNANQTGQGNTSNSSRTLRAPLTVGFSLPDQSAASVGGNFEKYLSRMPAMSSNANVSVSMEGRVAVLRGTVSTEHERDLAGRLALFEPGISDVRNELVVATAE